MKHRASADQHGLEPPATQTTDPDQTNGPPFSGRFSSAALADMIVEGAIVCLLLAGPFLSPLAWMAALAVVVAPVYRRLLRRPRSASPTEGLTVVLLALGLAGTISAAVPGLLCIFRVIGPSLV